MEGDKEQFLPGEWDRQRHSLKQNAASVSLKDLHEARDGGTCLQSTGEVGAGKSVKFIFNYIL